MIRGAVLVIVALLALAALAASEHARANAGLPLADAAMPLEGRVVIPWTLNTRCAIDRRNLPPRDPERRA